MVSSDVRRGHTTTTGMLLGTTCSDRSHERPMAPFALACTVTPAPCTAHVIAAPFVLAAIRAAGCCTETRVFINRGLVQMVGRGHWPPQPVSPSAATLNPPAGSSSKAESEIASSFDSFAACKGSLRQQPEGCSAHTPAARLGSGLPTGRTAHASAGPGSAALDVA